MKTGMTTARRRADRGVKVVSAVVVASALLWWAQPAFAHVEAQGVAGDGGATDVTFSFEHGCNGSPTTGLRIKLPDGAASVQPEPKAGWNYGVANGELTWSGGSIADNQPGEFKASMVIPGTQGTMVFFPTIQTCAQGQLDWIEPTPDPEATDAAPRIVLPVDGPITSTSTSTEPTTTTPTTEPTTTTSTSTSTTTSSSTTTTTAVGTTVPKPAVTESTNPWPWIILVLVAAVGAAIVGVLLYQRAQANKNKAGPGQPADPGAGAQPGSPGGTGQPGGPGAPGSGPPPTAPPTT